MKAIASSGHAVFAASRLIVSLIGVTAALCTVHGQQAVPDTLYWISAPSNALAGVPFAVSLQALDESGNLTSNFNGTVRLTAVARGTAPRLLVSEVAALSSRAVELCNVSDAPVAVSGWRVTFYDAATWPAPRATFIVPPGTLCAPHTVFQVSAGGNAPGVYPAFFLGTNLVWSSNLPDNPIAVVLRDREGTLVDFFCACGGYPSLINAPTPIPPAQWQGLPSSVNTSSSRTYQRFGGLDHDNAADWLTTNATLGSLNTGLRFPFSAPLRHFGISPATVQFSQGEWQGSLTLGEPATAVWLHADDGAGLVGDSGTFDVLAGTPLALELPAGGSEATAGVLGAGRVFIQQGLPTNLTVTLSMDLGGEVALPASVIMQAGQTNVSFAVTNLDDTVLDGTRAVTVTASAPGFASASGVITNADDELGVLTVTLPANAREGDGVLVGAGRVSVNVPVGVDFAVLLSSSNTNEVQVPATVYIPAGQTSAVFNITIINDAYLDGPQTATVQASAVGAQSGSAQLTVADNENPTLGLELYNPPSLIEEGRGIVSNAVRVTLGGLAASNVVVSLTSLNPARLQVPPTVVVPPGQSSVLTYFFVPDDTLTNGVAIVQVNASAPGFPDASNTTNVRDNDLHHFFVMAIPTAQVSRQPFAVTLYAHTIDGYIPSTYAGQAALRAISHAGSVSVNPSNITFAAGGWSGMVTLNEGAWGTLLLIDDGLGHTGTSNPIDVSGLQGPGLPVSDMVYDVSRGQLVAGVFSIAVTNANSIVGLNPATGQLLWSIPFGIEPGRMALADDGASLYVGQNTTGGVARVNLNSRSVARRFPLAGSALLVEDMEVVPGRPQTIVVSRKEFGPGFNQGVAVYDDGVPRPDIVGLDYVCCGYSVGNPDRSGAFFSAFSSGLRRLGLATNGIVLLQEGHGSGYGGDVVYASGLVYSTFGHVFDPVTLELKGSFPVAGFVQPDPENNVVFFLVQDAGRVSIQAFDITNRVRLTTLALPAVTGSPQGFVRMGKAGFSIRSSGGQWFLVTNSLVKTNASGSLPISISGPEAVVSNNFTFSISVSNAVTTAVQGLQLSDALGSNVEFVSAEFPAGSCSWVSNALTCRIDELAAGASATALVTLRAPKAGLLSHAVTAVGHSLSGGFASGAWVFFTSIRPGVLTDSVTIIQLPSRAGDDPVNGLHYPPSDLVFDAATGYLIVGLQRVGSFLEGGLAEFDPTSGRFGRMVALPHMPAKLAISPSGRQLYAVIESQWKTQPYDTVAASLGQPVSLPTGSRVLDMEVSPADPQLLAVSTYYVVGGIVQSGDTSIYDHGTRRTDTVHSPYIEFSSDGVFLYGSEGEAFYRNRVTATGLYREASLSFGGTFNAFTTDLRMARGLAHYGYGTVLDPNLLTYTNRYRVLGSPAIVCPDAQRQQVYFLENFTTNWVIEAFDMDTASLLGSAVIPQSAQASPLNLVRWGNEGLAFSTLEGRIFLMHISQMTSIPKLYVTQSISPNPARVGSNVAYSISVSNAGPGNADGVVLSDVLPRGSTFVSASSSRGDGSETNGSVTFSLGTLAAGEAVAASVLSVSGIGGLNTNWCQATARVFDTSSGANTSGTEYWVNLGGPPRLVHELNLPAADLAYAPSARKIYASVQGAFAGFSNSVLGIDVITAVRSDRVPITDMPGQLAISDNGQYLYVARLFTGGVSRIDLPASAVDLSFGLADADPPRYSGVGNMKVMPGQPGTLAVSVLRGQGNIGVYVYDAGVPRPGIGPASEYGGIHPIAFDGPTTIYQTRPFAFRRLSVGLSGVQFIDETTGLVPGYGTAFEFDSGLVYFTSGRVTDPVNRTNVGQFPVSGLVAPDAATGHVYFLTQAGDPFTGPLLTLRAFDAITRTELWSVALPPRSGNATRLITVGTNGLALSTDAMRIFLVRTASVPAPSADLSLEQTIFPASVVVNGTITAALTVRNNGLWTASGIRVLNPLPPDTSFVSGTAPGGSCAVSNNLVTCSLNSLNNGAVANVTIALRPSVSGPFTNTAIVVHDLSDPTPTNDHATATATILSPPNLSIADAVVLEGNSRTPISFSLTLSAASTLPVSVNYTTADGSAVAGQDYDATNGVITFSPGATTRTLTLSPGIQGNTTVQSDRFFFINLSNPTNALLARSQATGWVVEDDFNSISVQSASVVEGNTGRTNVIFTFSLAPASSNAVTVDYATLDGSATAGSDYLARGGTLSFSPGTTSLTLKIPVLGDLCNELDETFLLQLSASVNALLLSNEVTGRILNDDPVRVLRVLSLAPVGNGWRIQFTSACDRSYRLQRSETLTPASWLTVADPIAGTGGTVSVTDPMAPPAGHSFYRVELLP